MIELHYWPTPNGHKVTILLEEAGLPYTVVPVDIATGAQFQPDFLRIAPNNRMPAIIDDDPPGDELAPITVFESGAILTYLAEKTGKFLPKDTKSRYRVLQWLFWHVGGLGPMAKQTEHFTQYASEKVPYAIERYVKEIQRLYGVLDNRLAEREFIAGAYSIADMACYPWIKHHDRQRLKLSDFPNVKRWFEVLRDRPAVQRAYAKAAEIEAGRR